MVLGRVCHTKQRLNQGEDVLSSELYVMSSIDKHDSLIERRAMKMEEAMTDV